MIRSYLKQVEKGK